MFEMNVVCSDCQLHIIYDYGSRKNKIQQAKINMDSQIPMFGYLFKASSGKIWRINGDYMEISI